ncbi:MAG: hypothetical protein HN475_05790 [Piscirickettsiaceae bacterium]|jgi:hypothetical protein|nr:hypothetical protein [Piscirickettsiaceae bacterium]
MSAETTLHFDGREQANELALKLIQQAKSNICFFGSTLDNVLFDHAEVMAGLSAFSRRTPRAQARFIVHDSQQAIAQGHRLIALAQKLTSSIHIRISSEKYKGLKQTFLLIDNAAFLYSQTASRYNDRVCFDDVSESRQLQKLFNTIWEYGSPDPMTRRLTL